MRAQKPWPPCRRGDDGDWQRFGIWAAADSLARRLYSRAKRKSDADISKSPAVRVWLRQIRASSISSSLCVRMRIPPKRRISDSVQLPPMLAILQTTRWLNRDVEDRCNSVRYDDPWEFVHREQTRLTFCALRLSLFGTEAAAEEQTHRLGMCIVVVCL